MSEPGSDATNDNGPYIPLPPGLANPRVQAAAVFDRIAALYDRARPGYPPAALADLRRVCAVDHSTRIVEIGCGTGQLTRDLARSGASIRGLEPGRELSELSRSNLAAYPNVEIVTTPFEGFDDTPESYDLVISATAFHWIDPGIAYRGAASLLRPGGWLALLTNAHSSGGTHTSQPFAGEVRDLHRSLAPEVGDWQFPAGGEIARRASKGGDIAAVWARIERKLADPPDVSGMFGRPTVMTYPWIATYTRDAYVNMLASHSSYVLLEPARTERLLQGVGRLVDDLLDGSITKEYVTVLAMAPRRAASTLGGHG